MATTPKLTSLGVAMATELTMMSLLQRAWLRSGRYVSLVSVNFVQTVEFPLSPMHIVIIVKADLHWDALTLTNVRQPREQNIRLPRKRLMKLLVFVLWDPWAIVVVRVRLTSLWMLHIIVFLWVRPSTFRMMLCQRCYSLGKIAEKAVCRSVFLTQCRISKNALL